MNNINFYYAIPSSEFYIPFFTLILGLIIGGVCVYKIILSINQHSQFSWRYPDPHFIKIVFFLCFSILIDIIGLDHTISYIRHSNNTRNTIFIALTPEGVILPLQNHRTAHENLILPWNTITKIHLEAYSKRVGRRTNHYTQLYFNYIDQSGEAITSINSRYLGVDNLIFFTEVRKFYSGPIYKEVNPGEFQILKTISPHHFIWDKIPNKQ
jgi:hypothetical protein